MQDLISFLSSLSLSSYLILWSFLEVAFYIIICRIIHPRVEYLRKAPAHTKHTPLECLARLTNALERLRGEYSPETFWSGWFKGAKHADIYRENVKVHTINIFMCVCVYTCIYVCTCSAPL